MKPGDRVTLLSYAEIARLPGVECVEAGSIHEHLAHTAWGSYTLPKHEGIVATFGDGTTHEVVDVEADIFCLKNCNWGFHTSWVKYVVDATAHRSPEKVLPSTPPTTLQVGDRVLLWTYEEMRVFPYVTELVNHREASPKIYLGGGISWGGYPLYKDLYLNLHSILSMTKDKAATIVGLSQPWHVFVEQSPHPVLIACIKGLVNQSATQTPKEPKWKDLRLIRVRAGG